jgi:hypothetical protein
MGLVVLALVTSALFLPFIKKRTWLVVPMIVVSGLVIAHVLLFSYSQRSDRIKSTVGKTSQQPGQQLVASPTSDEKGGREMKRKETLELHPIFPIMIEGFSNHFLSSEFSAWSSSGKGKGKGKG